MTSLHSDPALSRRLRNIKHIILVLSGKGGVGKSSVSVQLALSLLSREKDAQVGLLDIDLTGPSIPHMLGLEGCSVLQSNDGWIPVHTSFSDESTTQDQGQKTLKCMSIGFLLKNPKDSVVWRGPKKNAMIHQFLVDVRWGELDYLIIDTPPGTSDEHISLLEQLAPLLTHQSTTLTASTSLPSLSSVLVTTPQAVSLLDVSKEYDFTQKTGLKVLGLIENMSGYLCPHCDEIQNIFGSGGGLDFCKKKSSSSNQTIDSKQQQGELKFLGKLPIDIEFMKLMDQAMDSNSQNSTKVLSNNNGSNRPLNSLSTPNHNSALINQYFRTKTSVIFSEICNKVVEAIQSLR